MLKFWNDLMWELACLFFSVLAGVLLGVFGASSKRTPTPAATGRHVDFQGGGPQGIDLQTETVEVASPFTAGVYNMHCARGLDGRTDIGRIADVVRGIDVVSLHEVKASFLNSPDQGSAVATVTGQSCLFSPSRRRYLRDYRGNALISSAGIGPWVREPLVDDTNKNYRIVTTTSVQIDGRAVPVLFTHLHTRGLRDRQLQTVFEKFLASGDGPGILLGDLNIRRDDPVMIETLAQESSVFDAINITLGNADPVDRVDWILTRGLDVIEGGMTPAGPSDHPFYWVKLVLKSTDLATTQLKTN